MLQYELPTVGEAPDPQFRSDVLNGLRERTRMLPARWFYDRRGSELFEEITQLSEYYPTRTEIDILKRAAATIAEKVGRGRVLVEFGSGSSVKTPILLSALDPKAYIPIDVSGEFLRDAAARLRLDYPSMPIIPIEGDFSHPLSLPLNMGASPIGFFPGSTIGNYAKSEASRLLTAFAKTLGPGSFLLLGVDRVKDEETLVRAYDDAEGVTAAFNLNLLHRINRELRGNIPVDRFRHLARWNASEKRIEMHLVAQSDLSFMIHGEQFKMAARETIHTENSHKYDLTDAFSLLQNAGWLPVNHWSDREDLFSVILARAS